MYWTTNVLKLIFFVISLWREIAKTGYGNNGSFNDMSRICMKYDYADKQDNKYTDNSSWFPNFEREHIWNQSVGNFVQNVYLPYHLTTELARPPSEQRYWSLVSLNSSPPGQNGRRFADDIFRCIFLNENICILIKYSLKFVPKGPIDNNPALVQIMAWRRISNKPLYEPMLTRFTDARMRH